jgi:hypothetical protein
MHKLVLNDSWVIYQPVIEGEVSGSDTVCGQTEWEEMERQRPGGQWLVQAGISTEEQAERLVRSTPADLRLPATQTPK